MLQRLALQSSSTLLQQQARRARSCSRSLCKLSSMGQFILAIVLSEELFVVREPGPWGLADQSNNQLSSQWINTVQKVRPKKKKLLSKNNIRCAVERTQFRARNSLVLETNEFLHTAFSGSSAEGFRLHQCQREGWDEVIWGNRDPCLLGSGHYFDKFRNSFCSLFVFWEGAAPQHGGS